MKLITNNGYCVYQGDSEHSFLNGFLVVDLEEGQVTYGGCFEEDVEVHLDVELPQDFTLLKYKYLEGEFSVSDLYESLCNELRNKRDGLLTETDVWGLSDYPVTAEQTAYRQALRDITSQAGFPENVTWPTKPE